MWIAKDFSTLTYLEGGGVIFSISILTFVGVTVLDLEIFVGCGEAPTKTHKQTGKKSLMLSISIICCVSVICILVQS